MNRPPSIEIICGHVDSSQISTLLFYLNQQAIQSNHLETGSRGQLLLFFPTDIKHKTYSCTEKKEVATRHRKKTTENFGKANSENRTAPFFSSKAIKASIL